MGALISLLLMSHAFQVPDFEVRVSTSTASAILSSVKDHCTLKEKNREQQLPVSVCAGLASRYLHILRNDYVHSATDRRGLNADVAIKFKGVEIQSVVSVRRSESCDFDGVCEADTISDIQKMVFEVLELSEKTASK